MLKTNIKLSDKDSMRICNICKDHGKHLAADCQDVIYHPRSEPTVINLCYNHSVELFKTGQTNFVSKYKPDTISKDFNFKEPNNPLSNYFVFNSFR